MARELRYYGLCARLVIHSCVEDEAVVKTRPSARDEASGCAVSAEGGESARGGAHSAEARELAATKNQQHDHTQGDRTYKNKRGPGP